MIVSRNNALKCCLVRVVLFLVVVVIVIVVVIFVVVVVGSPHYIHYLFFLLYRHVRVQELSCKPVGHNYSTLRYDAVVTSTVRGRRNGKNTK